MAPRQPVNLSTRSAPKQPRKVILMWPLISQKIQRPSTRTSAPSWGPSAAIQNRFFIRTSPAKDTAFSFRPPAAKKSLIPAALSSRDLDTSVGPSAVRENGAPGGPSAATLHFPLFQQSGKRLCHRPFNSPTNRSSIPPSVSPGNGPLVRPLSIQNIHLLIWPPNRQGTRLFI